MSDVTNTVIKAIENSRENGFEDVLIDVAKAFAFCGFFQCKNWSKIVESTFDANNLAVNTSNTEQASANEGNDALLLFNSQLAEFLQDDWNEMLPNNFIENIEAFDLNLLNDIEMELDRFEENFVLTSIDANKTPRKFNENDTNELHTPHKSNTASNEIFVPPSIHVNHPQILATLANDEASPQHIPIHTGQMHLNTPVDNQRFSDTSTLNRQNEKSSRHSENNVETTALIETSNVEFLNELPNEIVNQQLLMDVDVEPQNTNLMPPIRRISSAEDLLAELLSLSSDDDTLTSFTDENNRSYGQHNSDIAAETTSLSDKHEQHYPRGSQNFDSQLVTKPVEQTGDPFKEMQQLEIHSNEKSYVCDVCQRAFQSRSNLAIHKQFHTLEFQEIKDQHGQKSHVCDVCQKAFGDSSSLARHKLIHNGEKPHACDVCQKSFAQSSDLSRHKLIHTGQKPHACDVCQKSFATSSNLSRHKLIHTGVKPFVCDVCQRAFARSSHLEEHKTIHNGQKPHVCDVCQKAFAWSSNLLSHKRTHTGVKPFVCDVCQQAFAQSSNLASHKLIHNGQKPHVCDVCQKAFAQASNLLRHKRTHTGEKPFVCDVCQRAFVQSSNLAKHKLIHTGQKPHACDVCQKSFHQPAALSKHQRIQHGEHFTCAHCGHSFSQKADIELHLVQCFKQHNRRRKG